MNQLIVPIHPVSAILPCAASFLSILRFLMAFLQGISARPERRENSPASQAIPGEPKFEISGQAEVPEIALYRGEISFSRKSRFCGLGEQKYSAHQFGNPILHIRDHTFTFGQCDGFLLFWRGLALFNNKY